MLRSRRFPTFSQAFLRQGLAPCASLEVDASIPGPRPSTVKAKATYLISYLLKYCCFVQFGFKQGDVGIHVSVLVYDQGSPPLRVSGPPCLNLATCGSR